MAYASPIRAPDARTLPGVAGTADPVRANPAIGLLTPPRDAFKEKAERKAKQKAEKEARRKGLTAPAVAAALASAPGAFRKAEAAPKARAVAPNARPRLVARSEPRAGAAPAARTRPVFTVHVNPATVAATTTTAPPGPGPTAAAAPPLILSPPPSKPSARRGGGGGPPPPDDDKEKVVDRDLIMGGLISTALLLFLGWQVFGGNKSAQAPSSAPDPLLRVAEAPKPDAFPAGAPVELRPQEPLPSPLPEVTPTAEASLQAPPVAPAQPAEPEVKIAQAPPAKPAPVAGSVCEKVRMVQAYFCTESSTLTPDMRSVLDKQLTEWKACLGGEALVVKGYADTRGQSVYNAALSTARADTLRDLLKAHQLTVAETKGEGELAGLADNQNCSNQRRVDVSIGDAPPSTDCAKPKDAPLLSCRPPVSAPPAEQLQP